MIGQYISEKRQALNGWAAETKYGSLLTKELSLFGSSDEGLMSRIANSGLGKAGALSMGALGLVAAGDAFAGDVNYSQQVINSYKSGELDGELNLDGRSIRLREIGSEGVSMHVTLAQEKGKEVYQKGIATYIDMDGDGKLDDVINGLTFGETDSFYLYRDRSIDQAQEQFEAICKSLIKTENPSRKTDSQDCPPVNYSQQLVEAYASKDLDGNYFFPRQSTIDKEPSLKGASTGKFEVDGKNVSLDVWGNGRFSMSILTGDSLLYIADRNSDGIIDDIATGVPYGTDGHYRLERDGITADDLQQGQKMFEDIGAVLMEAHSQDEDKKRKDAESAAKKVLEKLR